MTRGYLDEVEAQLVERAGRPLAARAPRRRRELLALIPALAAAAAIVVAVVLAVSGGGSRSEHRGQPVAAGHRAAIRHRHARHHAPRTSTVPSHTVAVAPPVAPSAPAGPVPRRFVPESFTAISELRWWVLGRAPCSSPPCTSIVRTDDGGRSFVGIPAPRTSQVFDLRFANARDGFAYGPQLWVTHDAGGHWHQVVLPHGDPNGLAIGGGYVYAIGSVQQPPAAGQLFRAPVGSDEWRALPAKGQLGGLWVSGHDVILQADNAKGGNLLVSHDGGATFARYQPPPNVACQFQEPSPGVIWAPCATGMMSGVWRSTDGGASFRGAGGSATRNGAPEQPNSAAFAAASSTTAVYGWQRLYRTVDGGAHWSAVPTPAGVTQWRYLGFTDSTHGVALGWFGGPSSERLYYTTDGGASYHRVSIAGS